MKTNAPIRPFYKPSVALRLAHAAALPPLRDLEEYASANRVLILVTKRPPWEASRTLGERKRAVPRAIEGDVSSARALRFEVRAGDRAAYSPAAGLLRVWRDGRLIVDYAGPLGCPTRQGPYFKFGIYREPAPETIAVRYANPRFGGQELKSRAR